MLRFKKNLKLNTQKLHFSKNSSESNKAEPFINIFSTYNQAEIALIKSIFDNEALTYYIQDENLSQLYGAIPARIMVKKDQADFAIQLIKKLSAPTADNNDVSFDPVPDENIEDN